MPKPEIEFINPDTHYTMETSARGYLRDQRENSKL